MKLLFYVFIVFSSYSIAQEYHKELADLYSSGKFDVLILRANKLLQTDPNNSEINLLVGRSYFELFKIDLAKPYLIKVNEDVSCKLWIKAWALNYLGRIEFLKNNKHKSKEYFKECLKINATKNVNSSTDGLLKILAIDDLYSNFEIIETDNIKFYFQSNSVVPNKKLFIENREETFKYLKEYFNVEIPKKIDFVIWNSSEDAQRVGISQLGFAKPEYCVIHSRSNQTPGHELTHVITFYLLENSIKTKFINEGVAVYFDQSNNDRMKIIIDYQQKDSTDLKISIKDAWNNPKKYPEWVYYTLAGEFISRVLNKWGKEKLFELLKNQTYENAVLIYGEELKTTISELEIEVN